MPSIQICWPTWVLAAIGFVLTAWSVYQLIQSLWLAWNFERLHGFDEFPPDWIFIILSLWPILQSGVASVLLRRLARLGTAGKVERRLARFWVIPSLYFVGFYLWAFWDLASHPRFSAYLTSGLYNQISLSAGLAIVAFVLGSLPPLWVLSRQSPATR